MSYPTVADVMTRAVVTVSPSTSFKQVARLLTDHHVSAVPVVDEDRRPVGIVSEADLLLKEELAGTPRQPAGDQAVDRWAHGPARYKAAAVRAGMTVGEAARVLHARRLRHAPVVDDSGRLVGMAARSDLLRPCGHRDHDDLVRAAQTQAPGLTRGAGRRPGSCDSPG
jgi:CBS domain-containing protein